YRMPATRLRCSASGTWAVMMAACRTIRGLTKWYGIPRTTDEALWLSSVGYSPQIMPPGQIMEGRKGEKSRALKVYDGEQRGLIDAEITRRAIALMERQAQASKPFFAYVALTQPHLPTLPNPAFVGKTGNGDWADMLAETTTSGNCSMGWSASVCATTRS